jgi:hypothetical protein
MKRLALVFPLVVGIILVVSTLSLLSVAQQRASSAPASQAQDAQKQSTANPPDTAAADDPLFGVPPLPRGKVSLVGGRVQKIDRVRNRVAVKTFGDGKTMKFAFDERTHIYRDGVETTERGIQKGDRVYVDTMLDGPKLFARNIRVVTNLTPADARGQIMSYDARNGWMTVRDDLSAAPVSFRVTKETQVKSGNLNSPLDLVPGSLVAVQFSPERARRGIAREVTVLAIPGSTFTFAGKVRHLDLRTGMLALENQSDNKTYEIRFQPGLMGDDVTVGSDVTITAMFNGKAYEAKDVAVHTAARQ